MDPVNLLLENVKAFDSETRKLMCFCDKNIPHLLKECDTPKSEVIFGFNVTQTPNTEEPPKDSKMFKKLESRKRKYESTMDTKTKKQKPSEYFVRHTKILATVDNDFVKQKIVDDLVELLGISSILDTETVITSQKLLSWFKNPQSQDDNQPYVPKIKKIAKDCLLYQFGNSKTATNIIELSFVDDQSIARGNTLDTNNVSTTTTTTTTQSSKKNTNQSHIRCITKFCNGILNEWIGISLVVFEEQNCSENYNRFKKYKYKLAFPRLCNLTNDKKQYIFDYTLLDIQKRYYNN